MTFSIPLRQQDLVIPTPPGVFFRESVRGMQQASSSAQPKALLAKPQEHGTSPALGEGLGARKGGAQPSSLLSQDEPRGSCMPAPDPI